jgi:hypothetical protein
MALERRMLWLLVATEFAAGRRAKSSAARRARDEALLARALTLDGVGAAAGNAIALQEASPAAVGAGGHICWRHADARARARKLEDDQGHKRERFHPGNSVDETARAHC